MDYDVRLDGASIKGKIASFIVHKGRGLFCKELTLVLRDYTLYESFDFTQIPTTPRVEILTEVGGNWHSEGLFFIEQPDVVQDRDEITVPSLWGRDKNALLTLPFAVRISKEWTTETTLFAIFQEIIEGAGLEYSAARMLINTFTIYANSYSAVNRYPLDIIQELAGKTDGFLSPNCLNQLRILKDEFHWDPVETEISGGMIRNLTERVTFPDFAVRVRVGSYAREDETNFKISLSMSEASVAIGELITGRAVVTHNDGTPVADGHAVQWTTDNPAYAHWLHGVTHTGTVHIENEAQTASGNRRMVSTQYPIRQVYSVTEVANGQTKAVEKFEGRSITLAESLTFTNSAVTINYEAGGIADNTLYPGTIGEVEVDVHAIVATYVRDTATVRIDTESGDQAGDVAKYVTIEYFDFHTEILIPGVDHWFRDQYMGKTGEDGQLDIGLQPGGNWPVVGKKSGYQSSDDPDEGLANDVAHVGDIL